MPRTSSSTTDRKALHAYLSPEAHTIWSDYASEMGISLSALLEAIAQAGAINWKEASAVVKAARQIDADRRRRSRA
jgi:hypothetical protein